MCCCKPGTVLVGTSFMMGNSTCCHRMWLAIMSGQMIMYSTMPLLALHTLCDNGCMLRLLRHTWCVGVHHCWLFL